jgi:hypothetical protein
MVRQEHIWLARRLCFGPPFPAKLVRVKVPLVPGLLSQQRRFDVFTVIGADCSSLPSADGPPFAHHSSARSSAAISLAMATCLAARRACS